MQVLVLATYTGRNFGWPQGEKSQAKSHIVDIIQRDDGTYPLSAAPGGSYRNVPKGDTSVPEQFRLKAPFAVDIASDVEISAAVAKLVAHYFDDPKFLDKDVDKPVDSP